MQYNFDQSRRNEERQMHIFIAIILALLTLMTVITIIIICLPAPSVPVIGGVTTDDPSGGVTPSLGGPDVGSFENAGSMAGCEIEAVDTADPMEGINSSNAIVVDMSTGVALYAKGANERVQIASMTKVMTLITALELLESNSDMYKLVEIRTGEGYGYDLTGYQKAFRPGEKAYVIDLLYSVILQSGCDSALALAEVCAGGEEAFVAHMNDIAANKMGLTDTHFTNCYGADDEGKNYSTVREVGEMLLYALKNPLAYKIITTPSDTYKYYGYENYSIAHFCQSYVLDGMKKRDTGSVKILGGKSGNDTMAGYCLVSFGEAEGGHRYLVCAAGDTSVKNSYDDSARIYRNYVN